MHINDILTEIEYTKERPAKELFGWFTLKNNELRAWCWEHSETRTLRKIKYGTHRLFDRFAHELMPFAYYAKTYYGNKPKIRFKPCCGSEPHDGIIFDNSNKVFVEITNAIDGGKWGLQKELLTEYRHSPDEHNIHGVVGNKTKQNRLASDILTSNKWILGSVRIGKARELVKMVAAKKCEESVKTGLKYGQNKTLLIVTFDDTGFSKKDRDDFVDFKRTEVDSMKHNFRKIILFGWLDKKFIT